MFRKHKRVRAGVAAGFGLLLAISVAAPAHASSAADDAAWNELTTSLTTHLTQYGVPAAQQGAIIEGLRNGEFPDSMTGAAPTSSSTSIIGTAKVTVDRFADGSVSVTSVEQPAPAGTTPGGVSTFGVSGCTARTSGVNSYRTNCYVDRWDGVTWQNFRADFTFVSNAYDRIDSIYSRNGGIIGASGGGEVSFKIVKKYENASGPARAEYIIDGTLPYGIGYATRGLGLKVGASIGGQSYTF